MSKKKKQKIVEIRKMLKYIFCKKKVENYFLIYMYIKLLFKPKLSKYTCKNLD